MYHDKIKKNNSKGEGKAKGRREEKLLHLYSCICEVLKSIFCILTKSKGFEKEPQFFMICISWIFRIRQFHNKAYYEKMRVSSIAALEYACLFISVSADFETPWQVYTRVGLSGGNQRWRVVYKEETHSRSMVKMALSSLERRNCL